MTELRNTKQKCLILNCLKEEGHITAEEIIDRLKEKKTPVAKSTVYRYLAQLEECGMLRKYVVPDNQSACYQLVGPICSEHFHLMCLKCNNLEHFQSYDLEVLFLGMKEKTGLFIDGSRTVFYGHCSACSKGGAL